MKDKASITNSRERALNSRRELMKQEALKIDPKTAKVSQCWARTMDPYGFETDLPSEMRDQIHLQCFARRPRGHLWVSFYDLPEDTVKLLYERLESKKEKLVRDQVPWD